MQRTHRLKTLADFWEAIASGDKTFEVRENDRGYQTGDRLILERYVPGEVPSQIITKTVTYVLSGWGLKNGYVALGLSAENE